MQENELNYRTLSFELQDSPDQTLDVGMKQENGVVTSNFSPITSKKKLDANILLENAEKHCEVGLSASAEMVSPECIHSQSNSNKETQTTTEDTTDSTDHVLPHMWATVRDSATQTLYDYTFLTRKPEQRSELVYPSGTEASEV